MYVLKKSVAKIIGLQCFQTVGGKFFVNDLKFDFDYNYLLKFEL